MKGKFPFAPLAMFSGLLAVGGCSAQANDRNAVIQEALMAAPPALAKTVAVKDWKGNVLRKGTGSSGFVCLPRTPGSKVANSMCLDKTWVVMVDAWVNRKPYKPTRAGLAYMLAKDAGASNTDPFAKGPTATNQWVVEGPHLMMIVPGKGALDGIPTDPDNGGPYVMWKGTPYAHVMIPLK